MPRYQRQQILGDEHRSASETFEQHRAGGIDIGPLVHRVSQQLLGCHVLRGADHHTHRGQRLARLAGLPFGPLGQPCDPEVHHLQKPPGIHQQILRLDVAVDDPFLVSHLERTTHLLPDRERGRYVEMARIADQGRDRGAAHVFHGDEVDPVGFTEVVGAHHVPVSDPAGQAKLLLEPLQQRRVEGAELRA